MPNVVFNFACLSCVVSGVKYRLVDIGLRSTGCSPAEFASALSAASFHLAGDLPLLVSGEIPAWALAMVVQAGNAAPAVMLHDAAYGFVCIHSRSDLFFVGGVVAVEIENLVD